MNGAHLASEIRGGLDYAHDMSIIKTSPNFACQMFLEDIVKEQIMIDGRGKKTCMIVYFL